MQAIRTERRRGGPQLTRRVLELTIMLAFCACGAGAGEQPRAAGDGDTAPGDGDGPRGDGDGEDPMPGDGDAPGDGDGDGDGHDHTADDAGAGDCPMLEASGTGEMVGSADGLVPWPALVQRTAGVFALTAQSMVRASGDAQAPAELLREVLSRGTGYALPIVPLDTPCQSAAGVIVLQVDTTISEPERYVLDVSSESVTLRAGTPTGLLRGIATLRQLFPSAIEASGHGGKARWTIPALHIDDAPRFRYRGMHLDVSRHFFSVAFVKRYIDLLAAYKLNVFHFHLTDDQGWRIEIKKYPRLTEVGAFRDEGTRYGGFYTQDEVREIVAHASARGVQVIPEIEMPGHASAALAAYPEHACTSGPFEVQTTWGIFENIFCPTEHTFAFLEDVLSEVFELFPSHYVHIGGDEVPKRQWQESATAQDIIAREGLADEEALQAYFVRRIEAFARARGRTIVGWDEIVADGVPTTATIMAWRGIDEGKAAAEKGYDVVMTPNDEVYFDHYQANPQGEPKAFGGLTTVEDVHRFDPLPEGLSAQAAAHILGGQGNMWTEYMESESHVEYMLLPRAIALSEVLWSPRERPSYADFVARLAAHVPHLDAQGVHYAKHALAAVAMQKPFVAPHAIPGTIQAEDYDQGGEGVAYHDGSPGNTPAKYRSDDVDIEETPGGGHDVGYVEAGEWLEYTVQVASAGSYRVELRTAAPHTGAVLRLELDGSDVSGPIALPRTADWATFTTLGGPTLSLPSGAHVLRLRFENMGCNIDWMRFTAM